MMAAPPILGSDCKGKFPVAEKQGEGMHDRPRSIVGTRRFTSDSIEFKDLESSTSLQFLPCFKTDIVTTDEEAIHLL